MEKPTRKLTKPIDNGDKKATIQRYRIWKNEAKISFMELSKSSKHLRFLSFQRHKKNANSHHLPNRGTPRPSKLLPTGKQVENSSRHDPRHTKSSKRGIPRSGSHITMKKKVVHWFPISPAQATSVHNDDMPLPEIIYSKDLVWSYRPCKKSRPRRSLSPPHTLPREASTFRASQGAEGLDLEQWFLGRDLPKPINTISTHNGRVQYLKERSKDIHFRIMCLSNKAHVPLSKTAQNLHIIHNWDILHMSNTKKIRKNFI